MTSFAKTESSSSGSLYQETIDDNLRVLQQFPSVFHAAWLLSETMLPSEDNITRIKIKVSVSECLNALDALSKIATELELISLGNSH